MSPSRLSLALVLLLLEVLPVRAEEATVYTQERGPARVLVEGGEVQEGVVEVSLSGSLRVTFLVADGATLEVEPLPAPTPSEAWQVRQPITAPEKKVLGEGRTSWQQTFTVEPLRPGSVPLPLTPLRYRATRSGDWQTATWEAVSVRVTTEVTKADLKELRDIAPPLQPPAPQPWPRWPLWAGLALVLALGGLVGWRLSRRPTPALPPPLPHEWALGEMDSLQALDLPSRGETNRYHTLLSDILRRYLELRFQWHAPRQTTAEFLRTVSSSAELSAAQQEVLRQLLEQCDLAKFARVAPTPEECAARLASVRAFVMDTSFPAEPTVAVRPGR